MDAKRTNIHRSREQCKCVKQEQIYLNDYQQNTPLSGNPAAECDIPNLQHFLLKAAPVTEFRFQLNVYFLKKRISILSFEDECCFHLPEPLVGGDEFVVILVQEFG